MKDLENLSPQEREAVLAEIRKEIARRSLIEFCKYVDPKFQPAKHLIYIAQFLEDCFDRKIDRLQVRAPPRHGKSRLVSVKYVAWALGRDNRRKFILAANTVSLAEEFSIEVRNLIDSPRYKELFPETTISRGSRAAGEWRVDGVNEPTVIAVGVGSSIMGRGGTDIILDDPIAKEEEAYSAAFKDKLENWFVAELYNRREANGVIIINAHRYVSDDLQGRLEKLEEAGGDSWVKITLPAIAVENDPLGRNEGEALWPERWPAREIIRTEKMGAKGSRSFAAKYQQNPKPADGLMFRGEWMTDDKIVQATSEINKLSWFRYWDLAYSKNKKSSNSASMSAAVDRKGNVYFRRGWRDKVTSPELKRKVRDVLSSERDVIHGIEAKAHGGPVVQDLKEEIELINIAFKAVSVPPFSKDVRAVPLANKMSEGEVYFVREVPSDIIWIHNLWDELLDFPSPLTPNDMVDCCTGCLEMMGGTGNSNDKSVVSGDRGIQRATFGVESSNGRTSNNLPDMILSKRELPKAVRIARDQKNRGERFLGHGNVQFRNGGG